MTTLMAKSVMATTAPAAAGRHEVGARSLMRSAIAGIKWTSASTIVVTLVQLAQLAVLARLLQPSDFGLMAMGMVVIGFGQTFADMGVSNAIIHRQDATADQLSSLYWLNLAVGLVLFILVVALAPLVAAFYAEPRLRDLLLASAFMFLIAPIGQQFQALLQKELLFERLAKVEVTVTVFGFLIAILSALAGQGAFALVWCQLAVVTGTTLLLARLGGRVWRPRLHFALADLQGYLGFGLYQMGERSLRHLTVNLDKVLIGRLLGAQALGVYSVAYQLMIRPMQALNPIVTRVAFPIFSRIQTDDTRVRRGYLRMIQIIAFVSMPMYLGLFAVADPVITALLGARWHAAVGVFQILVFLGLGYSLGNPLGSLLLAKGRADLGFWCNVVALVLYGVAVTIGTRWGVEGVAWAILLTAVAILFPLEFALRWYLVRMRPIEFLRSFLPFLALGAFVAGVVMAADRALGFDSPHLRLAILVPVGIAAYALASVLSCRRFLTGLLEAVRSTR